MPHQKLLGGHAEISTQIQWTRRIGANRLEGAVLPRCGNFQQLSSCCLVKDRMIARATGQEGIRVLGW